MLKIDSFSNFDAVNFLVCEVLKALKIVFFFFFYTFNGDALTYLPRGKIKKKNFGRGLRSRHNLYLFSLELGPCCGVGN